MIKKRYILAAGLLVIAALISTWALRNTIIQRLSGPLLANYGLEIIDVSLDALATRDASIGFIELRHASGTTIAIEDLLLAVRESGGRRRYAASRMVVTLAYESDESSADVVALVRQVLGLPAVLQGVDILVGELVVDSFPTVSNVTWSLFEDRQALDLELGPDGLRFAVQRVSEQRYEARLDVVPVTGLPQQITWDITDQLDEIDVVMTADVDLPQWQQLAERLMRGGNAVKIDSGQAAVEVAIAMPADPAMSTTLEATVTPKSAWVIDMDPHRQFFIEIPSRIQLSGRLPEATWQLVTDSARLRATIKGWPAIEADLLRVSCRDGFECSSQTRLSSHSIDTAAGLVEQVDIAAGIELKTAGDTVAVTAPEGAEIVAGQLTIGDTAIERVVASMVSPSLYLARGSGWRLTASSVDAQVENLETAGISTGGPVYFEQVALAGSDEDMLLEAEMYVPGLPVSAATYDLTLPDIRGTLNYKAGELVARLETSGLAEDGDIHAVIDTVSGTGELGIGGAVNEFAMRRLSRILRLPLEEFDLTAGTASLDAKLEWSSKVPVHGSVNTRLADVAGFYSTTAFTGVSTDVVLDIEPSGAIRAEPAVLTAALVDIGMPLRDITGRYVLFPDESAVDVGDLRFDAFGGTIHVDPFSLRSNDMSNTVIVRVDSLDLAQLLTVQEFAAVDVTGRINGTFPVTVSSEGIRVEGGRIDGIAPGGVIRYKPDNAAAGSATSAMDIATKALSNFEYETLTSDVNYLENGDLVLKMQIRGQNPDMEDGRPVVLNLSVENNIPEMLRSLQASRSIEEILERRAKR